MCGITGVYLFNGDVTNYKKKAEKSVKILSHRGPDSNGIKVYNNAVLGHSRLSIIDLSDKASQPFEYKGVSVVFNGEIYNYKQLRQILLSKGFNFYTQSDTEVLAASYLAFGKDMLSYLNGDFAFAIYDKAKDSLFLARDRFGIKPLYFVNSSNFFAFASELNALECYLDNLPEIDYISLKILLEYTYIPSPFSIYKNVRKLPAGCFIDISQTKTHISSYYDVEKLYNTEETKEDADKIKKQLFFLMDDAVKKRLVADVNVGSFLSGGVDSSIVSALAKSHLNNLYTFSLGFSDYPFYDETIYANKVAKYIGSKHTVFDVTEKILFDTISEFLEKTSEPFADSSSLAFYILAKKTSKEISVVLSGDGADEIFGGYNKHRAFLLSKKIPFLKPFSRWLPHLLPSGTRDKRFFDSIRKLKKLLQVAGLSDYEKYVFLACFSCNLVSYSDFAKSIDDKIYELRIREMTLPMRMCANIDGFLVNDVYLVLQNDMLYKVDYYSMLNSLEVRVPFLDHNVVEYAFVIPSHFKLDENKGKIILKETFSSLLPNEIFDRPKHGFEIPVTSFLRNHFSEFSNLFEKDFVIEQGIFTYSFVREIEYKLKSNNHSLYMPLIWSYVVFQYWWKKKFYS